MCEMQYAQARESITDFSVENLTTSDTWLWMQAALVAIMQGGLWSLLVQIGGGCILLNIVLWFQIVWAIGEQQNKIKYFCSHSSICAFLSNSVMRLFKSPSKLTGPSSSLLLVVFMPRMSKVSNRCVFACLLEQTWLLLVRNLLNPFAMGELGNVIWNWRFSTSVTYCVNHPRICCLQS